MKKCDTCIYRNNVEQLKPCVVYRDDCKLYERGDMSNEDAVNIIKNGLNNNSIDCFDIKQYMAIYMAIKTLENIMALGEDMRICREAIIDEKVLIGFNMAVAICNKYLGEGEEV